MKTVYTLNWVEEVTLDDGAPGVKQYALNMTREDYVEELALRLARAGHLVSVETSTVQ